MTKTELFTKAHQIASYKDAEKVGNKIFRFLPNLKYATKFKTALKYLYKIAKSGEYFTSMRGKANADMPTMKQWDYLQRNRVDCGDDYSEFCKKYTKKTASSLIGSVIRHNEDGYSFAYKVS